MVKISLTNPVLVYYAVAVALGLIVAGKPLIEGGNLLRLPAAHVVLLSG